MLSLKREQKNNCFRSLNTRQVISTAHTACNICDIKTFSKFAMQIGQLHTAGGQQ